MTPHLKSFLWNENLKDNLRNVINSNKVRNKLDLLFPHTHAETPCNVDNLVKDFTEILNNSCRKVLPIRRQKKINKNNSKHKQKWFNQDCHTLKKNLRNLGNLLTKCPNDTYLRHTIFSKRKEYKSLLKGHWHPKFLLLISIRYTCGIFNFIFWPVCRV